MNLIDDVELWLLRTIVEEKQTCRKAAEQITCMIVQRCCEEIESLGGDNVEFHVNGVRKRLTPD